MNKDNLNIKVGDTGLTVHGVGDTANSVVIELESTVPFEAYQSLDMYFTPEQVEDIINKLQDNLNKINKRKVKVVNGAKYCRSSFDGYEVRLIVQVTDLKGEEHNVDLYTTQKRLTEVVIDLTDIINNNKVSYYKIVHHATKEQDDLCSKMIDETLENWLD